MERIKEQAPFLATTALEEFWDTTKPIIFLGEWCRRYSRRSIWEPLNGKVINSRWSEREKLLDAYKYVNVLYEQLLSCLSEALNSIHDVNYSERYWRIVLGPWLQLYISVIYDRYITLLDAFELHPDFTTIGLSEDSFVVPRNTLEFAQLIKGDSCNLQIYTNILLFMEKKFPIKKMNVIAVPFIKDEQFGNIRSIAHTLAKNIWKEMGGHLGNGSIVLRSSYFSSNLVLRLLIATRGKIWPVSGEVPELPFFAPDRQARPILQNLLPDNSEFEKLMKKMLPSDIPLCFIEGFKTVTKEVENSYPAKPTGIFSANAWYYDEVFKRWAAASAEDGTILMGTQHGGNYGSITPMPSEDHETAIVDRYYSWGWERSDCKATVIPISAPKLTGRGTIGADNQKDGILYVATSRPRYFLQFPFTSSSFVGYLNWQSLFMKHLSEEVLKKIRLRPHREDSGWDIKEHWKEIYRDILMEDWDISFLKSLENCRLFVCDHLETTFCEALSANIPTVLFWNPAINEIRVDAKPYYEHLYEVGILHYTPECAAATVNTIYEDVESWWNSPERQSARNMFCERFARTSFNALDEWSKEFKLIYRGHIKK